MKDNLETLRTEYEFWMKEKEKSERKTLRIIGILSEIKELILQEEDKLNDF